MPISTLCIQKCLTPILYACDAGHSDVVKVLLAYGANVNLQDNVSKLADWGYTIDWEIFIVTVKKNF